MINRGVFSGLKSLLIPPWAGGGDPVNDGALLGFDSTQPGGVKPVPVGTYAALGATGGRWTSGRYYGPEGTRTTIAGGLNVVLYSPLWVPASRSIDRIGASVGIAGTAGCVIRLGIYKDVGGMPAGLLLDAGTIDGTSATAQEIVVAQALTDTLYWVAGVSQVASATLVAGDVASRVPVGAASIGAATANQGYGGYYSTGVTGALPATATITAQTNQAYIVAVRAV